MPRKHFVLEDEADRILPELAARAGMSQGQLISHLILEEVKRQKDELRASSEAHRAYLAAHMAAGMCAEIRDMFNSYLHVFEGTVTGEQFRAFDEVPHAWGQKAAEREEYRRKVALDKKRRKSP